MIALLTAKVVQTASAFGGKSVSVEAEEFMPIKEILSRDDPRRAIAEYIGKETQEIFDEVMNAPDADPYITKAFKDNAIVWEALSILRGQKRC